MIFKFPENLGEVKSKSEEVYNDTLRWARCQNTVENETYVYMNLIGNQLGRFMSVSQIREQFEICLQQAIDLCKTVPDFKFNDGN